MTNYLFENEDGVIQLWRTTRTQQEVLDKFGGKKVVFLTDQQADLAALILAYASKHNNSLDTGMRKMKADLDLALKLIKSAKNS